MFACASAASCRNICYLSWFVSIVLWSALYKMDACLSVSNPRALRGFNPRAHPVIWRLNKKAWVTKAVFNDWYSSCFCPAVQKYPKERNIAFKVLLGLDNAPGHPTILGSMWESVKSFLCSRSSVFVAALGSKTIATLRPNTKEKHLNRQMLTFRNDSVTCFRGDYRRGSYR
jgi:hypothetical protein